jgi:hypothetical protein
MAAFASTMSISTLYTVTINTPQNLYLKSMRAGDTDVMVSGLDLGNGAASLDILMGINPPQVTAARW